MRSRSALLAAFVLVLGACGGPEGGRERVSLAESSHALETGVIGGATLALINEAVVDPDGNDGAYQLVELRGTPGGLLTGFQLVVMEGDTGGNQGRADLVVDLSAYAFGSNGLLVVRGTTAGHAIPAETTVVPVAAFDLENMGSVSILLVYSPTMPIVSGKDYDGNGGAFALEAGAVIVDAIGWGTKVYGGATFPRTPEALTRFANDDTERSAAAWFGGDMSAGTTSTTYDPAAVSANFPTGGVITPGAANVGSKPGVDAGTDASMADVFAEDTFAPETFVPETFVPETFVPETFAADTFVADTELTDAATPPDTDAVDVGDTQPADTGSAPDVAAADVMVVPVRDTGDTMVSDTGGAPPDDATAEAPMTDARVTSSPRDTGSPRDTTPVNEFESAEGGGCSCRTTTSSAPGRLGLVALAAIVALVRRRQGTRVSS